MTRKYEGRELAKVLAYFDLLEQNSTKFNIVCPFHEDKVASMLVNLEEGEFFCFACYVRGNALDFIKLLKPEYDDLQALIALEKILQDKKVADIRIIHRPKKRTRNKEQFEKTVMFYFGLNDTDWKHVKTKEEREVLNYMCDRGFDADSMQRVGCKMNYDKAYRVLLPVFDNGEYKGYVLRTTDKHVEKVRKYMYNSGFNKRNTLCGCYGKKKYVFVCEGYMDFMKLYAVGGMHSTVAILGWHISDIQVQKLKDSGVEYVVCALDNPVMDKYGKKGLEYLKKFFNVIPFMFSG